MIFKTGVVGLVVKAAEDGQLKLPSTRTEHLPKVKIIYTKFAVLDLQISVGSRRVGL